jgi:hypothetical protein
MLPPARLHLLFGLLLISFFIAAPGQEAAGRAQPAAVDQVRRPAA